MNNIPIKQINRSVKNGPVRKNKGKVNKDKLNKFSKLRYFMFIDFKL